MPTIQTIITLTFEEIKEILMRKYNKKIKKISVEGQTIIAEVESGTQN